MLERYTLSQVMRDLRSNGAMDAWDIMFSVNGCIFGSKGDLQRQVFSW